MPNAQWGPNNEPDSEDFERAIRQSYENSRVVGMPEWRRVDLKKQIVVPHGGVGWTAEDEKAYREWAGGVPFAPPTDVEAEPLPLWIHSLLVVAILFTAAALWAVLVWLLFF